MIVHNLYSAFAVVVGRRFKKHDRRTTSACHEPNPLDVFCGRRYARGQNDASPKSVTDMSTATSHSR